MLQIHWLYVQFKSNSSLLCLLPASLLFLGGCGTKMKTLGEELSDEYIDFEPTYSIEFDSRGGKADPS